MDYFHSENDPGFTNVWVSLTGTDSSHSPISFFPGTHQWGVVPLNSCLNRAVKAQQHEQQAYYCRALALENNKHIIARMALNCDVVAEDVNDDLLDQIPRLQLSTEPGDFIIFSGHVLHHISPNYSDKPRIAMSFRYRNAQEQPLVPINFGLTQDKLQQYYSHQELSDANMLADNGVIPVIQVSGERCHPDYQRINLSQLLNIMKAKGYE